MAKKSINIGGENFEYMGSIKQPSTHEQNYFDIFDAYSRPSQRKINVWNFWDNWLKNIMDITQDWFFCNRLWVATYNTFMFTIEGIITHPETNKLMFVRITPSHNYCWSITE